MRKLFFTITLILSALAGLAKAEECTTPDRVVLGAWPGHLGLVKIYVAEAILGADGKTAATRNCLEFEVAPMADLAQFDSAMQQGVPGGVYVSTDENSWAAGMTHVRDTGTGEKGVVIGHLGNSTYGLFARTGRELGLGSRIAVARCGWKDRDITEPLSPTEATEALSVPTLVLLPWLRSQKHRLWCGGKPPAGFAGIHLVPVGTAGKRDAAFADSNNGIDFMVQTMERSTSRTIGEKADLTLLVGPEVGPEALRRFPESMLIARASCLADVQCADVIGRMVRSVEEARQLLLAADEEKVAEIIQNYASDAGDKSSIKGAETTEVAGRLAHYLLAVELGQENPYRADLQLIIDENGWAGVKPEDLVDTRYVTLD